MKNTFINNTLFFYEYHTSFNPTLIDLNCVNPKRFRLNKVLNDMGKISVVRAKKQQNTVTKFESFKDKGNRGGV